MRVTSVKHASPLARTSFSANQSGKLGENGKGPRFFQGMFRLNRVDLFFLPRCGLPTVFSFSFRLGGLFGFAFCIGAIKIWMPPKRR